MTKNVHATAQLNASHMLQSNAQNSPGEVSIIHGQRIPDDQARFRKGRGTRD